MTKNKEFDRVICGKTKTPGQVGCMWSGVPSGFLVAHDMKIADLAKVAQEAREATN